jgi:hypothetical protein
MCRGASCAGPPCGRRKNHRKGSLAVKTPAREFFMGAPGKGHKAECRGHLFGTIIIDYPACDAADIDSPLMLLLWRLRL